MFKKSERRNRRGFTLAEVLTVVAIIGILLAVAIPNVLAYYRSLKLTELDDSAKTIFMAAQSRLTAMTAAGEDLTALGTSKTVNVPGVGDVVLTPVIEDANLDTIVLGGSIESQLHDGHYVVEIFPDSGVVYAVWYWEDDGDFEYSKAYNPVNPDKNERLKNGNMVGYYGGPGFDSNVERLKLNQTPIPSLQVTNAEELLLTITVPNPSGASFYMHIKATVTLSDDSGKCVIVKDAQLAEDSGNYTGKIVLDTLKSTGSYDTSGNSTFYVDKPKGKQFKEWSDIDNSNTYKITPGKDFDIEVKVEAEDTGKEYLPQRVYWRDVNSLFADVAGDTAHIAYGRHLQNLDAATSGVTGTITAAEQTRNIDFDATGVSDVYSWAKTYPGKTFTPIKNDNLTSYYGANRAISELVIDETGDNNVGLFGTTAAELDSIRLVNADVKGGNNVGALAGQYNGTAITNCGAYVDEVSKPATVAADEHPYDELTVEGAEHVGGLVGNITSAAALSQSFASVKVTGTTDVGGLVGQVNSNSTFTNCYSGGHTVGGTYKSDANVTGTAGVGGLVGAVADGNTLTLKEINYSTCSVKMDNTSLDTLGLLVGGSTGSVTEDTAADVKTYATGEAFDKDGNPAKKDDYKKETYLGDRGTNVIAPTNPFITVPYDETLKTTVYPYATNLKMHYGDWLKEASASSFCYYDVVNGTYGVWGYIVDPAGGTTTPVNTLASDTYATDDGYCVLVKVGDSAPTNVTVDGKSYDVEQIKDASNNAVTVEHDGTTYELHKITGLVADTTGTGTGIDVTTNYYYEIDLGGAKYWFNPFFACEIQKVPATGAIADAKPMEKPGAGGKDSTDPTDKYNEKVIIRTARQLANLAEQTEDEFDKGTDAQKAAQKRAYVQLLNIDYDKYTDADLKGKSSTGPRQTPASLSKDGGSYDGNHFFIRNLYIGEGTNKSGTGLFGNTQGTLSNIRLVNVSIESTSGNENHTGALAGRFQGDSVTDCGVYVDNTTGNKPTSVSDAYETFKVVRSSDKASTGGLIGSVKSGTKLEKCFAAVKVSGYDEVGGLIGKLNVDKDKTTTLTDCYSGGHTDGGDYKPDSGNRANVSGHNEVGGLIGYVTTTDTSGTATATLSGVNYSTCSVNVTDASSKEIGLLIGDVKNASNGNASVVLDTTTTPASTAYATGKAFDGTGTEVNPRDETTGYSLITDLTNSAIKATAAKTTTPHPYDNHWDSATKYPYLSNLGDHYGDWVEPKFQVSAFLYWEKENGVYKYSVTAWQREKGATGWTGLTIDPTLCNSYDQEGIEDYGYGWFYAGDFDDSDPTMTGASGGTSDTDAESALKSSLNTALETALPGVDLGTVTVEAYSYNSTTASGTAQTWTIQQGSETLQTATLNPDFADTITTTGTVATPYKVRTIRQLQNINHTAYLAQSFIQGHDLDGGGFTYTPIGIGTGDGFTGSYDGQGYRIRNLNISVTGEDACAGLFGKASGDAKFMRIIMWGNNNTISASDNTGGVLNDGRARVGGIVAEISNGSVSISNCVVAGYKFEIYASGAIWPASNNVYAGGIVANLHGTVTNCEAVVEIENSGGNAYIGGLVGEIGSGSVTNSYAGGSIATSDTTCVGGLVGKATSDNQITNSFSYVKNAHYAINGNGRTHNSCAYFGDTFNLLQSNSAHRCASVAELTNWLNSNTTFQNAGRVYDGSGEVSGETFNGAVVQVPTEPGGNPVYVHYGDLPA